MDISEKAEDGALRLYVYDYDGGSGCPGWTVEDRNSDRDGDAWLSTELSADEGKAVAAFLEDYRRRKAGGAEASDRFCRELWSGMEDVPFDDNGGELLLGQSFYIWKRGTPRREIWKWFDAHYSRGVASLLYTGGE